MMRRLFERLRHLAPVAVLLFLGFGVVLATPQEAAAQGRRLALAGPAGISTERPLCESILRSLNAEPSRGSPDWRRADPRFVTWQLLRIETIPPGQPYDEYAPSNLIEVVRVDILNEGKPRNVYRVNFFDPFPMGRTSEEFLFFLKDEDDPLPALSVWGRDGTDDLPDHVVEIEFKLYPNPKLGVNRWHEFPPFANATGLYFRQNFQRGRKYHRSEPDHKIDLLMTETGRVLAVLETGSTAMIVEFRHDQAQPICYFALAHEERLLEVVGPASGRELETTCLKIASAVNGEIERVLANPGSSRSRLVYFNTQAELLRDPSLFLRWQPAYHAPVYRGAPSPFHFGSGRTGNQIGPYENETIEMIEATILNDGILRRVFRYTESTMLSSLELFSQHLIFQADNPEGIAGAPPGETVWWFRHFAGRGIYRDVEGHFLGPKVAGSFEHGDYKAFFEKFPPHATPLGQRFKTEFATFIHGGSFGYGEKEFDLIGLEDGRVLVIVERRRFSAREQPLILVLELRPDRAIPVCYLG
jgi:hypothetical protein